MQALALELVRAGAVRSPDIREAFESIDRADFVPESERDLSYEDIPLPIGEGQTISQPYTVAFMLELLAPRCGSVVLEAGYGSGWQTALLSHLVGDEGHVYAFEILPALCEFGRHNIAAYPNIARRATLMCESAEKGFVDGAPFDRIICAAEVDDAPCAWREQLQAGGRMVYPSHGAMVLEIKDENGRFEAKEFGSFSFVPFMRNK